MKQYIEQADVQYFEFSRDGYSFTVADMSYPIVWVLQDRVRIKVTFVEFIQSIIDFLLEDEEGEETENDNV